MIHRALFNRPVALSNKHMFSGPICMEQRAYLALFNRNRALFMIHRALFNRLVALSERWGAGVEYHFQEI